MTIIDCNKEMKGYHSEEVNLSNAEQAEMRSRRDNGRTRLQNGLTKAGHPLPKKFSSQGSYAMRTMVQDDACDYDIDDGAYFDKEDLKNAEGDYLSALDVRKRVKKALKDDRLAYDAVVKTNCVRQEYPDGYHIDIPIYRTTCSKDIWGNDVIEYELASGDEWTKSDARKVTSWYNDAVGNELKTGESDTSQMRRITKLTKKMARSRNAWKKKTTSGICISKLVVDNFIACPNRDDDALRDTWKAIKLQLDVSQRISHPVFTDKNLAEEDDECVIFFRGCLGDALEVLKVLDEQDCTSKKAGDAWDEVFNTTYFSAQFTTTSKSLLRPAVAASTTLSFPSHPVQPNKSSGFAS
ncbi:MULTISPECIES: cyclic GMP-AMP synthase DncV-like nucleotidyltransferase [Enterobacter]|uniref:cyclic GMP-AMP synthase DncV-like nucleotidyltransferase n=1 Tax=Enterobacter TaxID=547 RepID=UPI0007ADA65C|nr:MULTISPECIES: hypothetical protein [Enterobacter]AMZ77797.1 hypothetical protein A4308_12635 [Enterobacter sp. ODB01]EKS6337400.1 hypothetical protein [Enterobacter hormaechei]VAL43289.1 Uncharacterised protein [Enterobacter kobei]